MNNSEPLSQLVLNSLPTGIMLLRSVRNEFNFITDFQWSLINPSAEKIMHCRSENIINKSFNETYTSQRSDELFKDLIQVVNTGDSVRKENLYDFQGIDLGVPAIITKFEDGILFNLMINTQVSILSRNEDSIAVSEYLDYERIFDETQEAIALIGVVSNDSFTLLRDNLSHRRKTGIDPNTFFNKSIESIFDSDIATDLIQKYKRCLKEGALTFQEKRSHKGMQRIWQTTLTTIDDSRGYRFILSCSTDITDKKRIEEELSRYRNDLEDSSLRLKNALSRTADASRAKGEFLSNMSHEIRTPLNGVIGMSDLLNDTELDAEQKQYVEVIRSSSKMLLRIINDILDFSNMETGRIQLEKQLFNLENVIESCMNIFRSKASDKNINLKFSLEEDVPINLLGDPGRLVQIFVNLIGNAIKFTESGQIELVVTKVSESREANIKLHFLVRDTGIGVPESKAHLLFKPFSQIDGSFTRRYEGTGLGLSICDRLVRMMNGIIGYNSNPRGGSEFWFTAMFQVSELDYVQPIKILSPIIKSNMPKLKILIVEDNVVNQKVARSILRKIGYDADLSSNGQDAIDKLKNEYYNLILMDIQMPVLDGIEATKRIRLYENSNQISPSVIIAMTAQAMEGDKNLCLQVGMNDYISKPIEKSDIEKMILRWT
ncbi:response regulator [Leptospira sp. GIMC2001]|uniref:response regulator n=1 Tax=Leptospira sp. GIMC2001 TaxID=1513297 RepID=UPI00234964E9|nr:response regulator [Leptospira sp. GIMC2001]WCL48822.1 ATP-binding protein [Leptospira sp. GIMC2001]